MLVANDGYPSSETSGEKVAHGDRADQAALDHERMESPA